MRSVILVASLAHPSLYELASLVRSELLARGEEEPRTFDLGSMKLAHCQGEFDCWVKTPGVCRAHDAEQEIVEALHAARSLVLVDHVMFGGHSFLLKRAQDRLICLLKPYFEKRAALTHHGLRYDHAFDLFSVGLLGNEDAGQAETYASLADANAVNMLAPHVGVALVHEDRQGEWSERIRAMLACEEEPGARIDSRETLTRALKVAAAPDATVLPAVAPFKVALVVGSAKIKGTSASECIARAMARRFEGEGLTPGLHFATEFIHDESAARAASDIAGADLFVLVTPLYVDSLPALATRVLERVAGARAQAVPGARFALVVNCGFPEPEQNRTALRIARHFAAAARYHWAGGLPLGAGGLLDPLRPLDAQHGPAEHVAQALDRAVAALARGENIPEEALALMLQRPVPDALYRLIGDLGWRYLAHKNGLRQRSIKARPLDA